MENSVIGVNIQELKKLLKKDIEFDPSDENLKKISDDISYLHSTSCPDLHQMTALVRLDESNFMEALHNIERYGLKHIHNRNGIDFNQTKCITFEDSTEYLANYKHDHRTGRVINMFTEDSRSENPKFYSFTIS